MDKINFIERISYSLNSIEGEYGENGEPSGKYPIRRTEQINKVYDCIKDKLFETINYKWKLVFNEIPNLKDSKMVDTEITIYCDNDFISERIASVIRRNLPFINVKEFNIVPFS